MNELKPEDVMRALELHADCEMDNCFECPYEKYLSKADGNCVHHLSMDALALLREKDAEIERLTEERDKAQAICVQMGKLNQAEIAKARAEAITEFEKKLMEKKCHYTETEHTFDFDGVTVEDIEQTAKELKVEPDEL